jgi:branched-chain amino acid transport system substrate-binding protein
MKSTLKKSILALGLAAGLGSTVLAQDVRGVTDAEIVIGSNGDLSGVFAPFNVQAIKAAQQHFDEINEAGGIHGRKIRFVVEDHGYQVPKAVQNFNKLINSDQVFAMILNLGTPHNIAGFQMMEPNKVANISPLSAGRQMIEGDTTYKYTGGSSYYDQLKAAIEHLAKETGAQEICAMYFPSDFGLEVHEGTKEKAEELGLTYAAETTHRPDEQDFVGSLTKLRDAGCDIVATAVGVRQTITILGTAKQLGWNDVTFVGSSAAMNTAVAKVPGGVTEGYYAAASWADIESLLDDPEVKEWADAFQAEFGEAPGTAAQLGKAAAETLTRALEAAGPELTPESFQTGMETLDFQEPITDAHVTYGPGDHQGSDQIIINQIRDGQWAEVTRVDPTESQ